MILVIRGEGSVSGSISKVRTQAVCILDTSAILNEPDLRKYRGSSGWGEKDNTPVTFVLPISVLVQLEEMPRKEERGLAYRRSRFLKQLTELPRGALSDVLPLDDYTFVQLLPYTFYCGSDSTTRILRDGRDREILHIAELYHDRGKKVYIALADAVMNVISREKGFIPLFIPGSENDSLDSSGPEKSKITPPPSEDYQKPSEA
jgi:hypothetical protein